MISVEEIVWELQRIDRELPVCITECSVCRSEASNAMSGLSIFGGADGGACACLSGAMSSLTSAHGALCRLSTGIIGAVNQITK